MGEHPASHGPNIPLIELHNPDAGRQQEPPKAAYEPPLCIHGHLVRDHRDCKPVYGTREDEAW